MMETDQLAPTASQTVGPFFGVGTSAGNRTELVPPGTPHALRIRGRVLDGDGEGVPDALVEIWQADGLGRYPPQADWQGFGRCPTDPDGSFGFVTVKPGSVSGQAPHVDVSVFARGLLQRLVTRIYFPEEERANAADPVLARVPAHRRATLVAKRAAEGEYVFDVRLQGDGETVFFALS